MSYQLRDQGDLRGRMAFTAAGQGASTGSSIRQAGGTSSSGSSCCNILAPLVTALSRCPALDHATTCCPLCWSAGSPSPANPQVFNPSRPSPASKLPPALLTCKSAATQGCSRRRFCSICHSRTAGLTAGWAGKNHNRVRVSRGEGMHNLTTSAP